MGRFLLLLVAASSLTTGSVLANRGLDARAGGNALAQNHLGIVVAERLSETGLEEATELVSTLTGLPATSTLRGELDGGTYTVQIVPTPPRLLTVTSVGEVTGVGREGTVRHTREATFELRASTSGAPPVARFLGQALTLEQSLTMNTSQRVLSADPALNANIHTNGGSYVNITENAGIQGFYQSVTPPTQQWQKDRLARAFRPNANPSGLAVYQTVERIEIPVIRVADYLSKATLVSATNVQPSGGVIDFSATSTAENPAVWVIRGDLNINGGKSVEVKGFVNIIASGNININGSLQTAAGSTLSLYSERDISINGSAQITGSLMNNQNIQLSGSTVLTGPVTTRGTVNFNGNAKIVYQSLSGYMTAPLFGGTAATTAVGFRMVSVRA